MGRMKLSEITRRVKNELTVYQLVLKDKRTPLLGKVFLGLAVGYLLLPFDLIPDFIPVLGVLDDIIIIPFLVVIALKIIPEEIIVECRKKARN